jgi:hypothetical protein
VAVTLRYIRNSSAYTSGPTDEECAAEASELLGELRDAIHRDGDDGFAIREALGLRWERAIDQNYRPLGRRVVGEWREVQ